MKWHAGEKAALIEKIAKNAAAGAENMRPRGRKSSTNERNGEKCCRRRRKQAAEGEKKQHKLKK